MNHESSLHWQRWIYPIEVSCHFSCSEARSSTSWGLVDFKKCYQMISPPVQSPNYRFLSLSHRAVVAWRMNMFNGVRYAVALWVATLKQVLGRKDPARLAPSILPYVHSYCHLNWVGSLCLPSHMAMHVHAVSNSCPLHLSVRMLWLHGTGRSWTQHGHNPKGFLWDPTPKN